MVRARLINSGPTDVFPVAVPGVVVSNVVWEPDGPGSS
jgi:hypothetical protein